MFDSKKEARVAQEYDLMQKAKVLKDWNTQVKITFEVTVDGRLVAKCQSVYLPKPDPKDKAACRLCSYVIDFLLVHSDNSIELVEVKSAATKTRIWRLKQKMLEATLLRQHPGIKYSVIE